MTKTHTLKRLEIPLTLNQVEYLFWTAKSVVEYGFAPKMWVQQENGVKIPIVMCKLRTSPEVAKKAPFIPVCILIPVLFKTEHVDTTIYSGYGVPVHVIRPPLRDNLAPLLEKYMFSVYGKRKEDRWKKKEKPEDTPQHIKETPLSFNADDANAPQPNF